MIVEFSVENCWSYKDETTLSMMASKPFREHRDTHTVAADKALNLIKSAVIYGDNASGKSNLLMAIGFMKELVLNSFREALQENSEKQFPLEKFMLNSASEQDASFFEMVFVQNGVRYRYGFEIDYDKVVAEWLFQSKGKEVYLFKREFQHIQINKSAFKEGLGREEDVKENVLFLSLLATFGKPVSMEVVNWFKKLRFVNGMHDRGHKRYTVHKLKSDKEFLNWVLHFVSYLEIVNISTVEEEAGDITALIPKAIKDEELLNFLTSVQKIQPRFKDEQLITYHRKYDKNNLFIGTVPFDVDRQESEGTKKLLYLLGPWYEALRNGHILIVDELDARLHNKLTLRLIDFFHQSNQQQAQLIAAVHDVALLNHETFRRDQIWFVEKNQFGASQLFSLADFKTDKVRGQTAFAKNYLEGRYGAVPYFEADKKLNELLYGEKEG